MPSRVGVFGSVQTLDLPHALVETVPYCVDLDPLSVPSQELQGAPAGVIVWMMVTVVVLISGPMSPFMLLVVVVVSAVTDVGWSGAGFASTMVPRGREGGRARPSSRERERSLSPRLFQVLLVGCFGCGGITADTLVWQWRRKENALQPKYLRLDEDVLRVDRDVVGVDRERATTCVGLRFEIK